MSSHAPQRMLQRILQRKPQQLLHQTTHSRGRAQAEGITPRAAPQLATSHSPASLTSPTIGLDLGDRTSKSYEIDALGERIKEATVATTPEALGNYFTERARSLGECLVAMEAGTHSPWVSRLVSGLGHRAVVANPSEVYGPKRRRKRKNDRLDAELLARQARADERLLYPIVHRGAEAQEHLAMLRARDQLVRSRSKLINHVRGSVKAVGARISACSAEAFAKRATTELPRELRSALSPLLLTIAQLSKQIASYDRAVTALIEKHYPECQRLQEIRGVGPLTSLAFVLLIDDPSRFGKSRQVGAYFGLVPRLDESGESSPQLRITKAGDELGRRLLVSAAQYILGPFGPPCDLKRHGETIAERGGRNARKRAVVAVARKLSVTLHRLWVSGEAYDPNHVLERKQELENSENSRTRSTQPVR